MAKTLPHHAITIELTVRGAADFFQYLDGKKCRTPKIPRNAKAGVKWICRVNGEKHDAFAVHFDGSWPLDKGRYMSANGAVVANFPPDRRGPTGRFKYFVAVFYKGRIWTDDPDMIVW